MKWRLGLDIGTNSIGWAALELCGDIRQPVKLMDTGVRIFSDSRTQKTSNLLLRPDVDQEHRGAIVTDTLCVENGSWKSSSPTG